MRGKRKARGISVYDEVDLLLTLLVLNCADESPVRIFIGDGVQFLVRIRFTENPLRALFYKSRKVTDIVIARLIENFGPFSMIHHGGFAVVAHMIRPALLVESQIPIDPAFAAVIEIAYDLGARISPRGSSRRSLPRPAPPSTR